MIVTKELIDTGQKFLSELFDDHLVYYSEIACDMHNCTSGNHMKIPNGKILNYRRYIKHQYNRKSLYWCYPKN